MRRQVVLALGLLGVFAATATAGQQPVKAARTGEEVIVIQAASGEELRGRLVELSSNSLAMLVDGRRVEVPIDNVLRIDSRHDSVSNGAIIGGVVFGGMCAAFCGQGTINGGQYAYAVSMNALFGALIGAGIDALHKGRSPIFIKPARGGSSL